MPSVVTLSKEICYREADFNSSIDDIRLMHNRSYLVVYFLVVAITFAVGFQIISAPQIAGYLCLLALFAIPVAHAADQAGEYIGIVYVFITPLVPMVLAVDPVEIGLFGHDPYIFSMVSLGEIATGNLNSAINEGSYPLTYLLTVILIRVFAITAESTAKYIPLLTVSVPLFVYVFCLRRMAVQYALIAAIIAASTRTLLLFETKFVDEILAVVLAFLFFYCLETITDRKGTLLSLLFAVAIVLSHHAVTAIVGLFLLIRSLTPRIMPLISASSVPILSKIRINHSQSSFTGNFAVTIGILLLVIPVFFATRFFAFVLRHLTHALQGQTTPTSGSPTVESGTGLLDILSTSLMLSLIALTLFAIYMCLRSISTEWELSWLVFVGTMGIGYALMLVLGRAIPLDPIRLLIFIVPLLGVVALAKSAGLSEQRRPAIAVIIAILLIVPNLAAIPSHVLISDISSKPATAEGHFTEAQWASSLWASQYDNRQISGYEPDLWLATDNQYEGQKWATCEESTFVQRNGFKDVNDMTSTVYSSGDVHLARCDSVPE